MLKSHRRLGGGRKKGSFSARPHPEADGVYCLSAIRGTGTRLFVRTQRGVNVAR